MKLTVPLMAVACFSSQVGWASEQASQDCFERLTTYAIERPRLPGSWIERPQFDVSADGKTMVYVERTASVAENEVTDTLWRAEAKAPERRHLVAVLQKGGSSGDLARSNPTFAPDGVTVAILGGPAAGGIAIFSGVGDAPRKIFFAGEAIVDFRWSPDGKSIALQVSKQDGSVERSGLDVPRNWDGHSFAGHHQSIAVIDVAMLEDYARLGGKEEVSHAQALLVAR